MSDHPQAELAPDLLAVCIHPDCGRSIVDDARAFADQHQLSSLVSSAPQAHVQNQYLLFFENSRVSIVSTGKRAPGPVFISFVDGGMDHRRKFGGGKNQPLAKALGINKKNNMAVIDATAGLARDAFVMATLGAKVTLLERSPFIARLIRSGIEQAQHSDIADIVSRMELIQADARIWLRTRPAHIADVIYLDPMFPARDKSALVKKEMQLFHKLVGADMDEAELLESALERAKYRVVVKRPRLADSIEGSAPSFALTGKTTRYDVYTIRAIDA